MCIFKGKTIAFSESTWNFISQESRSDLGSWLVPDQFLLEVLDGFSTFLKSYGPSLRR